MKCPRCGLVTFDDLPQCPRCEESFALVRPLASGANRGARHVLREDPELHTKLRDRLHRARLDRRKDNENPLAAGTDPDAPEWFDPEMNDGGGPSDITLPTGPAGGERSEEGESVYSDDLEPDEEMRGAAATADATEDELEVGGLSPDPDEPEFTGEIPGFSDWREELRERLKRIRARREEERLAAEAEALEAGDEDPAEAIESGEADVASLEAFEAVDAESPHLEVVEIENTELEEIGAVEADLGSHEIAGEVDFTIDGDSLISEVGDLEQILSGGEEKPAPEEDEAGTTLDHLILEQSPEHLLVDLEMLSDTTDAEVADTVATLDLGKQEDEEAGPMMVEDAGLASTPEAIEGSTAESGAGLGAEDLEDGPPESDEESEWGQASVFVADVSSTLPGPILETEAEPEIGPEPFEADAEETVYVEPSEAETGEIDVEPPEAETGEIDVERFEAETGVDLEPAAAGMEEVDLEPAAAATEEAEVDIEPPGSESEAPVEQEPFVASEPHIDLPAPVSPVFPRSEGQIAPKLDFEPTALSEAAKVVPSPEIDVSVTESDAAPALEWDSEAAATPAARSSAGPLGERAAAALCDLLVLIMIAAALVGAASSGTGQPFRQILANEAVWLGLTWMIFAAGYSVFFVGSCGQTIGRMVMQLRVVGTDQFTVGFDRAAIRLGAWVVALLPLGAGLLPALRDPQRRGLHDRLSRTRVVKA